LKLSKQLKELKVQHSALQSTISKRHHTKDTGVDPHLLKKEKDIEDMGWKFYVMHEI
jgi:hypothetical protein